jgi:hypothetical protein
MAEYIRTQVLLEKKQRQQLDEIAKNTGVSFSELVRQFLDSQLRIRVYEEMRLAAIQLYGDYTQDEQLTDMTTLDSEDFLNG